MEECKVVEVKDIETPYNLRYTMIDPMKYKNYSRKEKKQEDNNLIKEWEEEI